MTYRIDYPKIVNQTTSELRAFAVQSEVRACDYVCLTDAIVNFSTGGTMVMEYLGNEAKDMTLVDQRVFRLRVLCDTWGKKLKQGDKVVVKKMKPLLTLAGKKLRSTAINDMKRRGTFERDYIIRREYEVDEFGLITCGYEDACRLLSSYGVNFETDPKVPICGRRKECSGESLAPDGKMRRVQYWRYEEVPPWKYEKLLEKKESSKQEKKRK